MQRRARVRRLSLAWLLAAARRGRERGRHEARRGDGRRGGAARGDAIRPGRGARAQGARADGRFRAHRVRRGGPQGRGGGGRVPGGSRRVPQAPRARSTRPWAHASPPPGAIAEAVRYLRRGGRPGAGAASETALARSLVAAGRGREALAHAAGRPAGALSAEAIEVAGAAVDAEGLPSLQLEIDRARIAGRRSRRRSSRSTARCAPQRKPASRRASRCGSRRRSSPSSTWPSRPAGPAPQTSRRSSDWCLRASCRGWCRCGPEQDRALRQVMTLYRYAGRSCSASPMALSWA